MVRLVSVPITAIVQEIAHFVNSLVNVSRETYTMGSMPISFLGLVRLIFRVSISSLLWWSVYI